MRIERRIISVILMMLLFLSIVYFPTLAMKDENFAGWDYDEYREEKGILPYGEKKILTVSDISERSENVQMLENVNSTGIGGTIIPDDGFAVWQFTSESDCAYTVKVKYMSVEASGGNMELELNIDGEIPFTEVSIVSFERCYEQAAGEFNKNKSGNDIKPDVTEVFLWSEKSISDSSGYKTEPFTFDFTAGEHKLTLRGSRGKIAIAEITLEAPEEFKSYEEYEKDLSKYSPAKAKIIELEAEHFKYKNSVTILPVTDRSSAATTPQSPSALLLNTMGGDNWKSIGNAATWEFEVKESGLYEISTRFLQNTKDGIFTCRKFYVDGKVPFDEAKSIRFDYSSGWQCEKLGKGGKPFTFYLEKGNHTLTLEVTAGEVADIISTVAASINELNRVNRRIKLITGNNVDVNRDYNFAGLIPDEI